MPTVSDIMTTEVQVVEPQESLRRAARLMQQFDVGLLPVCADSRLLGVITDRDIAIRGVAEGLHGDSACVSDVMSEQVACCPPEFDTAQAMQLMGERQVRRLPVVDASRSLLGIVSLADLATRQSGHIDDAVREISSPATAPAAQGLAS